MSDTPPDRMRLAPARASSRLLAKHRASAAQPPSGRHASSVTGSFICQPAPRRMATGHVAARHSHSSGSSPRARRRTNTAPFLAVTSRPSRQNAGCARKSASFASTGWKRTVSVPRLGPVTRRSSPHSPEATPTEAVMTRRSSVVVNVTVPPAYRQGRSAASRRDGVKGVPSAYRVRPSGAYISTPPLLARHEPSAPHNSAYTPFDSGQYAGASGCHCSPSRENAGRSRAGSGGAVSGLRLRRRIGPPSGVRSASSGRNAPQAGSAMKCRRMTPPLRQFAAAHRLMPRWWLMKHMTGSPPRPARPGVRSRASYSP